MKQGAILLEVLIASAVSSILSMALLTAVYQISRVQVSVTSVIDVYSRATLVHRQFDRDFSGAYVPIQARPPQPKPAPEPKKQPEKSDKKEESPKPENKTEQEQAPPIKPLEKVFFVTQKEQNFELITWISTNPMIVYWGATTGHPIPRVSRVVYRLQPDEQKPGTYKLMRQESDILEFAAYASEAEQQIRNYELISGIKKCSLVYIAEYTENQKEETSNKEQESPKEEPKKEYRQFSVWGTEEIQQLIKEKNIPEIPNTIIMHLEIIDTRKKVRTFDFAFNRITDLEPIPEKKPESKKEPDKKKDTKNGKKEEEFSVSGFIGGIIKKAQK